MVSDATDYRTSPKKLLSLEDGTLALQVGRRKA
jgi:hypothetical protein